jgi:hypothetical protein
MSTAFHAARDWILPKADMSGGRPFFQSDAPRRVSSNAQDAERRSAAVDRDLKIASAASAERKTNAQHSANVEAAERAKASRPAIGSRSLSGRTGPLSSRSQGGKTGRGFYHPDRIEERAIKRRERIDSRRFGP